MKFRWYVALLLLAIMLLLLGVSGVYGGGVLFNKIPADGLGLFGGLICIALGLITGFIGIIFFVDRLSRLIVAYRERLDGSGPSEW